MFLSNSLRATAGVVAVNYDPVLERQKQETTESSRPEWSKE